MAESGWISPKGKPPSVCSKHLSPSEASSPLKKRAKHSFPAPDRKVSNFPSRSSSMAESPWISPKGKPPSVGSKRSSPSEASSPLKKTAKPLFPSPDRKVPRGPLATMMATWKRFLAEGEDVAPVQGFLNNDPPFITKSSESVLIELNSNVEEVEVIAKEDSPPPSSPFPLFCPFEMCGDTWDECVAKVEIHMKKLEDGSSESLFCPFEMCGDTWDECVAKVEIHMKELEDKWNADNP